jgi:hypothetical protein
MMSLLLVKRLRKSNKSFGTDPIDASVNETETTLAIKVAGIIPTGVFINS